MSAGNGNKNGNGYWGDIERNWREAVLDLKDRVAVVTGGARGIGRTTSYALALEGIKAVAVVDMGDDVHEICANANQKLGREVLAPFQGDVTQREFRRQVFASMEQRFGPISICVPAAGITRDRLAVRLDKTTGEVDMYPEEEFRRVMEIDLTAPIYWGLETMASVAKHRQQTGKGRWDPSEGIQGVVVLIGSVSSAGNKGQISYATAKAGLEGAQATMAAEAVYYGVRCAIIHPGYTDTAMVRALGDQFINSNVIPFTQLRRLLRPEEIAHAICFLIRNASVSGQLWADAGWHPTP